MDIVQSFKQLWQRLQEEGFIPLQAPLHRISLDIPNNPQHGHLASNAPLILGAFMKTNPRSIGERILKEISHNPWIESAVWAPPGFLNLTLIPRYWQQTVTRILENPQQYATHEAKEEKVIIECLSANPTGPLHAGHARVLAVANSIANLAANAGYQVVREYYINDSGQQALTLARSLYWYYAKALGDVDSETPPEGYYGGAYMQDLGKKLAQEVGSQWYGKPEDTWCAVFQCWAVQEIMSLIRKDLEALGVEIDSYISQAYLEKAGIVAKAMETLQQKGCSYMGTLPPPRGGGSLAGIYEEPLLLLKTSSFGDTQDRPLTRAGGEWTYLAADIGYHVYKKERGATWMINVFGADHTGHVRSLNAGLKAALGEEMPPMDTVLCQMVHFSAGDVRLKMSKRSGQFIPVSELCALVGVDVLKMMMLTHKGDTHLHIDVDHALRAAADNPVFYLQYAHARCCSVLRGAREILGEEYTTHAALLGADKALLQREAESQLMRCLHRFPQVTLFALATLEPNRIVDYLQELASNFHILWQQGKKDEKQRLIYTKDVALSISRLALVQATIHVLAKGLRLLGIRALESL